MRTFASRLGKEQVQWLLSKQIQHHFPFSENLEMATRLTNSKGNVGDYST